MVVCVSAGHSRRITIIQDRMRYTVCLKKNSATRLLKTVPGFLKSLMNIRMRNVNLRGLETM